MQLENLIRHENAHSGLAFCAPADGKFSRTELLRHVLALANAEVSGTRCLVLGVRDVVGGQRAIVGLSKDALHEAKVVLSTIVARVIEPSLRLAIKELSLDGATVGLVSITACNDPPYLLNSDLSASLHTGRGWIRRGAQLLPLNRRELQRMFNRKRATHSPISVKVGFPGKIVHDELTLAALPLDALPSERAAEQLRKMLEARQASREMLGRTDTRIDRLLHAQQFGNQLAYEDHSDQSLRARLDSIADQYGVADQYYQFELRAHKIAIMLCNESDTALDRAALLLKIPCLEGIGVAERLYTPAGSAADSDAYPVVDAGERSIRVQAEIGPVPARSTVAAFREPPRLWVREAAAGTTIAVGVVLTSQQLLEPCLATLRVRIVAAQAGAKPSRRLEAKC